MVLVMAVAILLALAAPALADSIYAEAYGWFKYGYSYVQYGGLCFDPMWASTPCGAIWKTRTPAPPEPRSSSPTPSPSSEPPGLLETKRRESRSRRCAFCRSLSASCRVRVAESCTGA